jgi:hypothetical protein
MFVPWKALLVAFIVPGVVSLTLKPEIVDSSECVQKSAGILLTALQVD